MLMRKTKKEIYLMLGLIKFDYQTVQLEEQRDDEQREFMQYYFDAFKKIYNIDYEIDDPIVSELMDESTNPIYVYNSDNIDDENNIDEEELKDVYKQVLGLFDKFKSKPVIFGEQDIGKTTADTSTQKKVKLKSKLQEMNKN